MRRLKVLIFSILDFSSEHGATLWGKNFLQSMARVSNVDFIVVFSGPASIRATNQELVEALGFNYTFVPFRELSVPKGNSIFDRIARTVLCVLDILMEKYYFWGEHECRKQKHVDSALVGIIKEKQPDLVIISAMTAAFYVPSVFSLSTPCCLISLNNEIPLYRQLKSQGGLVSMGRVELWIFRHFNWIPNIRVRRFINSIYKQCAGIVTLTCSDLPTDLSNHVVRAVMPPLLSRSDQKWRYRGTRCVLFVGNIFSGTVMHFPNRLAIEWMCIHLAPELSRIDDKVRINIIGASKDQVPSSWHCVNVNFMGRSNREELVQQMTTADLFIAPIANNYGAKLKLAECVSHGMPFVATDGAMSGLPFLPCIPRIHLNEPRAAARLVLEYINSPEELTKLSQSILALAERARTEQDAAWNVFFARAVGRSQENVSLSLGARSSCRTGGRGRSPDVPLRRS